MQTVAALLDADFSSAMRVYLELLKLTHKMTRDQRVVEKMLCPMLLNVRRQNHDDHLKNPAFQMDAVGAWSLDSAYDLRFSRRSDGAHTLLVGRAGRKPGRARFDPIAEKPCVWPRQAARDR